MATRIRNIKFKLGELFCGPGGIAVGASMAQVTKGSTRYSIEHTWASDYHEDTCKTYEFNFPDVKVLCEDVKKLDIGSLGDIDAFAYGFPCNDFSIVGESKGFDGDFGGLYKFGIKVLNKYNPKFFIAENVGGLTSANEGKALKKIIYDLERAGDNGYDLTIHKYKFEEYGVPLTCPGIFRPKAFRDNDSFNLRSRYEESTVFRRTDCSDIARGRSFANSRSC